jgi:hypothetical protein
MWADPLNRNEECNLNYDTRQLTPWNTVLLEKLIVAKLVKKFPVLYGT